MEKTKVAHGKVRRIVMTTFGSLGDLYPYLAIASALQSRGHSAVIATSETYRHLIEAEGIEFHPIRPDAVTKVKQDPEFFQLMMDSQRGIEYLICHLLLPHLRASYLDLMQAVHQADLLLTHPLTLAGSLVAQKTGIPWVSSLLSPNSLMSAYDAPPDSAPVAYEQALTRVAKDASLRHLRWNARHWSAPIRQLQAELGLPPSDTIFEGQHALNLVLALFSRALATPQPDWPPQTRITGFPFYEGVPKPGGASELVKFLDCGSPPIVFTLGSTAVLTPGNFYLEGAAAAASLGYRAVLLMGQQAHQILPKSLPKGVAVFDYAPHSLIFPRASAIVHHGGVGTTGEALRSGRPMLIVPYGYEQPDNAERMVRLGVARMIDRQAYSATVVAAELQQLLSDPSYGAKAAAARQIVQAEAGVAAVCDALEEQIKCPTQVTYSA